MKTPEPFSTHRPWDEETHLAYREQPLRNGYHFQLEADCSPAEKEQWRSWCKRFPRHWPGHVRSYIAKVKYEAGR